MYHKKYCELCYEILQKKLRKEWDTAKNAVSKGTAFRDLVWLFRQYLSVHGKKNHVRFQFCAVCKKVLPVANSRRASEIADLKTIRLVPRLTHRRRRYSLLSVRCGAGGQSPSSPLTTPNARWDCHSNWAYHCSPSHSCFSATLATLSAASATTPPPYRPDSRVASLLPPDVGGC
jgi:hypothetical protein